MKNVILCFVLMIINQSSLISQIQKFPPDELKLSNYTANLGNDRFLPSTSRYNLVWADQLVPSWHTEKQIEFAAKNYIGTQKIWANQIDVFRQFNPNFLGLIYHLAVGLNPEKNDDCPNPKSNSGDGFIGVVSPAGYVSEWNTHFLPWLQSKNIELGSTRFEDMFQHWDSDDLAHRVWHNDPYWLMNIQNTDWQDYTINQCLNWMDGNQNEGCFFDVSVETYCSLYNPKSGNPEPMNYNWWQLPQKPTNSDVAFNSPSEFAKWMNESYLKYYQKIFKAFHGGEYDRLVIPNVDQMVTTVYDPVWMDGDANGETIDGAMIEGFGNYRGQDMYLTLERCIRHITGRGKILIAQFNADTPEERYRRTAMYMLVKNDNSYIYMNPGEVGWYPEYEIDLGNCLSIVKNIDELRIEGSGWKSLWRRDYENGLILCNTSDNTYQIETPAVPVNQNDAGKIWSIIRTSGGGEVGDDGIIKAQSITTYPKSPSTYINITPSECLIIYSEPYTDVELPTLSKNSISIFPNPANESINIEFGIGLLYGKYTIVNELGLVFNSGYIKNNNIVLSTNKFQSGIYFLIIQRSNDFFRKKIIVLK